MNNEQRAIEPAVRSNAVIRKITYSNIAHRLCHLQMSKEQ